MRIASVVLLILLSAQLVSAHGGEAENEAAGLPIEPLNVIYIASLIIFVTTLVSLAFSSHLTDWERKAAFLLIAIPAAFATTYVVADTLYLNIYSESGGPVHWHADIRMTVCGEVQKLPHPESLLDNKVGTNTLHHHNEGAEEGLNGYYRIHVEGVVFSMADVELGEFFRVIGGYLTDDSIGIPAGHDRVKTWTNGDLCPDGRPATLRMTVNGEPNGEFGEYVIAPYTNVPPGDVIELEFG